MVEDRSGNDGRLEGKVEEGARQHSQLTVILPQEKATADPEKKKGVFGEGPRECEFGRLFESYINHTFRKEF
jgi:hypothetical protein